MCPRCKSRLWNVPRNRARGRTKPASGFGLEEAVIPYRSRILKLARAYGVHSLRVYGSVARGEAGLDSDLDLLFDSRQPLGLLRRAEFKEKLEAIVGRRVDLARPQYLRWHVKPTALAEAVPL